ncbi:MAG: sulfatase-like hydrolase/transferase, partial [Verrucomicrobia bacterium]|nr:sulfatase-like hydrolase/transferase [Verrucomicrobiota bacterium]
GTNIWALPLYPVAAATNDLVATNKFTQGAIALAANGIPIFNPYNNTGKISAQIGELDYWGGHCGRGDDYHYHAAPLHLTNTLGVSVPLAFAMDGYPVYGLVEPDGSAFATNTLDNVAGHTNGTGSYHYHASTNFPYVNGGFHGVITIVTNGSATQAGIQPKAGGVRPAGTPLAGAYIQIFTNLGPDQFQMFYSLPSNSSPAFATNYWLYTLNRASNSVTVTYSSYDGVSGPTTTNYANWKPAPAFTSTNEPLVTTQPTNLTRPAGSNTSFSITAAGLGTLAYQWFKDGVELANGGGIGGVNTTTLNVTNVQAGDAGAYSVVVTNTVGNTLSASAILTVNGAPSNTPPTLTAISNRTLLPGDSLVITNVASDAETPGLLTFSLTNSPPGAGITTNTGILTWVTSVTNAGTTNPFTVVVADNGSPNLTASQSFTVTVLGIGGTNTAPVFAAATNRYVINGGDTISITNLATDAEAPPQTLAYSLLTGPVGATINTNTGVVTWITTTNNSGTSNLFRVVVTDNGSPILSATNSFTVFARSLKPNVILFVTDDQGYHDISAHGAEAPTPNMDRIGSEGIRLERFYATPVCSVTRSTLLTGRNPVRTGVNNSHGLDLREHLMPVTFKAAGYQTFMCGKWHLGGLYNNTNTTVINGATNTVIRENVDYQPQVRGWDTHYGEYTGAINYLAHTSQENGQLDWWLNGQTNLDAGWSTDLLAAKAVSLLQNRDPSKPVILYLAFNAVHPGVSAPTNYLNKYLSITNVTRRTMVAALDQMDVGIGSVLNTLDAEGIATNTLVVYFSDNGADTNGGGLNLPLRGTKSDLFDAGIHTPAAVRWPGVLPSGVTNCQQFIWAGDWFPTICTAAGVTPLNTKPFDGVNMWPLLLTATNGAFNPTNYRGSPLVSGSSAGSGVFDVFSSGTNLTMFKLIRDKLAGNTFSNYLFDIINDPSESNDVVNVPAYSNIVATLSTYYSNLTAEAYSPYIGAHPTNQTVTAGANVTLWAMTTVYPKTVTTQWRKNGTNIVGQTNRTTLETSVYLPRLDLTNVTTADSGNYDMVVTDNAVGWPTTVTSLVAVVTVNTAGSNTAPVLGVITNRTISVGSTLLVTNVATDAEAPPQVLTYTLPVAPTNAAINANSGVIAWTPLAGQANTTNTFTTVATDNGTPNLSATNSFLVTVLSNVSPFLSITGVAISPAAPTSNDLVSVTATIASSATVTQALLSYSTGAGGAGATNTVFSETMTPTAVTNGWDGTGADNLWTVVSLGGAGNLKQASNANHTPVGQGGQCGVEMGKGSTNASDTMVTTTSNINATGASGYVEFWLGTVNVTNGLGWTFQLSTNGTTFITRTNESDGTVHGIQKYHYDLLPSELVSTLKIRFQFIGNNVGGPTGPKVRIDDIIVATAMAGGAAYTNVAMADDGAHQDGAAGDGVFGAQIPAFPTGTTVSYYLTAANSGGLSATNPVGAPASNFSYTVTTAVVSNGWSMLKLPDTGQTNDYTPTFGEDSDYAINPQSFTDNGNGTVTDNVTGLMWQKADGGEMTLSNALLYAATNLNSANFAGYADWRLATVHELMSILNHDKVNPALNANFFTASGVTNYGEVYWWSRDQQLNRTNQWCANAGGGVGPKPISETISAGGTLNYRVRCVRGATAPATNSPTHHFVNNANGTITDTDTGLTWQQGEVGAATDWTNALTYAENLVLGGFQDWRLPNIKELESLNDETLASPSIDTNYFPNAKSARYWSSTTQFGHATNAWWNEFVGGITSYDLKPTAYWVRAVRGGLSNTAPLLAAISNRTINADVTLLITNTATDAQAAPGFLTFSLLTSLTNAGINSTSGVFNWRAPVAQAGTTNAVRVVVADSGAPVLTATQLFNITVLPFSNPPGVATLNFSGNQLQLQITGDAGPDYTVQASSNLAGWTNLFTTNSPTLPFFWLDPNAGSYTSRFYRVLLGP